jgi:hypothetical protein
MSSSANRRGRHEVRAEVVETGKPNTVQLIPENIPDELKARPQWVNWRWEKRYGKDTKPPINPKTGWYASPTDPKSWGTFTEAVKRYQDNPKIDGIGFVFLANDPYAGVDLDDCRDPKTGSIEPKPLKIIETLGTYTEISPSATGAKAILKGGLPEGFSHGGGKNEATKIEVYDKARYFCITGNLLNGSPKTIEYRDAEFKALCHEHFGHQQPVAPQPTQLKPQSPQCLFQWNGDIAHLPVKDETRRLILEGKSKGKRSNAIMSVVNALVYCNLTDSQIFEIFERYPIGEKWRKEHKSKAKWLQGRITKARNYVQNRAEAPRNKAGQRANAGESGDMVGLIAELNQKHAVIMVGGRCCVMNEVFDPTFNRPDVTFSSYDDFRNRYSNLKTQVPDGQGKTKLVSVAKLWLESPDRRSYQGITFTPGKDIPGYYNLWRGFGVEPKPGNWSKTQAHMLNVICRGNDDHFIYLYAWMAHKIQKPGGDRPGVSVVLRGGKGTGKGIFVRGYGSLCGSHFLHVTNPKHLIGRFNSHLKDCVLLFADEAFWAGDKEGESVLKGLITEPVIMIEPKGKDAFTVSNHVDVIIAGNHEWVGPATFDERRFFVLDVSNEKVGDHGYFRGIADELDDGGREAMLYDLLHEDISGINLRAVPQTEALLNQKMLSADPLTQWWLDRLHAGEQLKDASVFKPSDQDHQSAWQVSIPTEFLHAEYVKYSQARGERRTKSVNHFSKELRKICPGITGPSRYSVKVPESLLRTETAWLTRRMYCLVFPSLEECRDLFCKVVRKEIEWPQEG